MFKFSFWTLILISLSVFAQQPTKKPLNGSLTGKVTDAANAEAIPFAQIVLTGKDSTAKFFTTTDMDGFYSFKNIKSGTFKISVRYIGYADYVTNGIIITSGKNTVLALSFPLR